MRRVLLIAVVLFAVAAFAVPTNTNYVARDAWAKSLNAVAATGAGDGYRLTESGFYKAFTNIAWKTSFTGSPTAITVNLEGSNDGGTTWATVDTSTSTAGESRSVSGRYFDYLRCNITAYTVNSSTATCEFKGVSQTTIDAAYPGVSSCGVGCIAAGATATYKITGSGANAAGVMHDDGLGNMSSSKVTSADTDATIQPANNPAFTGTVTIPTPALGSNTTVAASTAFVQSYANMAWIRPVAPTFSPVAGTYSSTQNVTVSCAAGTPYYSTNGTTVTAYSTPVAVSTNTTMTARCENAHYDNSLVASAPYIIQITQASDNFAGSSLDANWSIGGGGFGVSSAKVNPNNPTGTLLSWAHYVGTFTANQFSQLTVTAYATGKTMGTAVCVANGGANTLYYAGWYNNTLNLQKVVAGTPTTIAGTSTVSVSDVIKIGVTVSGGTNTVTVYKNGSAIGGLYTYADSAGDVSCSAGSPGIYGYGAASTASGGTWSGGNQ